SLSAYRHVRATGINAINIAEGDELIDVQINNGDGGVSLATRDGMAIRGDESDVGEMGRVATGVRGITLDEGDHVVGMVVVRRDAAPETTLLVVTENGRGKRTPVGEYRLQYRGGKGVINFKTNGKSGKVVAIKEVQKGDELMLITRNGVVNRVRCDEIRVIGRATQGVRVMALDEGDVLVDVARLVPEDEENGGAGDAEPAPDNLESDELAPAGGAPSLEEQIGE